MLPRAILFGMTPEQFWEDDPYDFECYQKAYRLQQEAKYKEMDIMSYSQGKYNLLAFAQVMANSFSKSSKEIFPKEPLSMQEPKDKNQEMLDKFKAMAEMWNAQFEKKNKKEGGE